jgi:hypothetical protein
MTWAEPFSELTRKPKQIVPALLPEKRIFRSRRLAAAGSAVKPRLREHARKAASDGQRSILTWVFYPSYGSGPVTNAAGLFTPSAKRSSALIV